MHINPEFLATRARADELAAKKVDDLTIAEVEELRGLNDKLDEFAKLRPHPGHPTPAGSRLSRRDVPAGEYGRVTGIGDAFITGTKALLDGTSGGTLVPPFFDPQIRNLPQRSLFVRSVIPTVQATGDKVWYLRQTVATQNAAAVAANAEKPKSTYTVERVEETVRTVAHVTEALDRALLSDYDQLSGFLDEQLRLGVLLEEERQILNGSGVAPNMRGILNTAGIQTQAKGADPTPDAVYKAMTKIRAAFMEPDAVVVHPNDWQDVRLLRTADGRYIWGDPAQAGPETIWSKPVITSPVIAEGTMLVGAFGVSCQAWDREQARVTFTEAGLGDAAGQEMFTRNQVRFRGESRIAFGVIRPSGFCTVTGV